MTKTVSLGTGFTVFIWIKLIPFTKTVYIQIIYFNKYSRDKNVIYLQTVYYKK